MTYQILTFISLILAIASAWFAAWATRRARYFEQSMKFRKNAIGVTDEVLGDPQAPDEAKRIAAILRVMSVSPKTLRNISAAASVLKVNANGKDLFDGIAARYADPLMRAIKNLAIAAMLDDPTHAAALSKILSDQRKPQQNLKDVEVAAIRGVVYQVSKQAAKDRSYRLAAVY